MIRQLSPGQVAGMDPSAKRRYGVEQFFTCDQTVTTWNSNPKLYTDESGVKGLDW